MGAGRVWGSTGHRPRRWTSSPPLCSTGLRRQGKTFYLEKGKQAARDPCPRAPQPGLEKARVPRLGPGCTAVRRLGRRPAPGKRRWTADMPGAVKGQGDNDRLRARLQLAWGTQGRAPGATASLAHEPLRYNRAESGCRRPVPAQGTWGQGSGHTPGLPFSDPSSDRGQIETSAPDKGTTGQGHSGVWGPSTPSAPLHPCSGWHWGTLPLPHEPAPSLHLAPLQRPRAPLPPTASGAWLTPKLSGRYLSINPGLIGP